MAVGAGGGDPRASRRGGCYFDPTEVSPRPRASGSGGKASGPRPTMADPGAPPIPVGGAGNDLIAVAVGIVAYLALAFVFHPVVIGVAVIGN